MLSILRPHGISTHALREEGDVDGYASSAQILHFYPRPPRGGRRTARCRFLPVCRISTHALREEGDVPPLASVSRMCYFYPRPPRGGRRPGLSYYNRR